MDAERWRRIEALVEGAAAREGAERAAFLDAACAGDDELRQEVESLLAEQPGADGFLTSGAWRPPALAPGTKLGPHEILGLVGSGGMGEVYKARDTRLDRIVALKILPPDVNGDPDRRTRFAREAKTISQLNHPNICTLFDIGEAALPSTEYRVPSPESPVPFDSAQGRPSPVSVSYLVMEFLEGETLGARLTKGPLPLAQALELGAEIADALAAAHKHGVVHRDLKPGNVMLTKAGAKLLDFGLAKLKAGAGRWALGAGDDLRPAATTAEPLTGRGVIVGTLPYMSPEQLEGKPADARTDLWALGTILYEMLTGARAFEGDTSASLIGAIVEREPEPLAARQPLTPPALDRAVRRCLAKDPDERWQTAQDLVAEIRWLSESSLEAVVVDAAGHPGGRRAVRARFAWTTAALAVVVAAWNWPTATPAEHVSMRLAITLPPDMPLAPAGLVSPAHDRPALALSPDGSRLAYVALVGGKTQICVRDMRTGSVSPLEGTVGGHTPFFSPDGAWIGFFADNKLKKMPSRGGAATVLADAPSPWGATWGSDDAIYFNRFEGEGIYRVAAAGGPVEEVVEPYARMPALVRGTPGLLVSGGGRGRALGVHYVEPRNPSSARFVVRGPGARYVPTGHVLYAFGGRLMAMPFSVSRMEPAGPAVALAENVRSANDYGVVQFTVSDEGTLVYAPGRPHNLTSFVWVDRKSGTEPLGLPEDTYQPYALSPDNERVAFGLGGDIYVYDCSRGTTHRVTPREAAGNPVPNMYPRWTPDGTAILYFSLPQGSRPRLMSVPVDGSTEPVELWRAKDTGPARLYPMGFSPDHSVLSVFGPNPGGSFDLFLMRATKPGTWVAWGEPELFLGSTFGEMFGQISPDGRWMVFASDRSGAYEIYVTSYPKPGAIHQVSKNGGREPMWNPAAPEIVYVSGSAMYAVAVTESPEFRTGEPRLLFDGAYPDTPGLGYDLARDGQRFLMLENKNLLTPTTTLTVITNLFDELRRLAPGRED